MSQGLPSYFDYTMILLRIFGNDSGGQWPTHVNKQLSVQTVENLSETTPVVVKKKTKWEDT